MAAVSVDGCVGLLHVAVSCLHAGQPGNSGV